MRDFGVNKDVTDLLKSMAVKKCEDNKALIEPQKTVSPLRSRKKTTVKKPVTDQLNTSIQSISEYNTTNWSKIKNNLI